MVACDLCAAGSANQQTGRDMPCEVCEIDENQYQASTGQGTCDLCTFPSHMPDPLGIMCCKVNITRYNYDQVAVPEEGQPAGCGGPAAAAAPPTPEPPPR